MGKIVYLGMISDIMHPGLINIINEGAKYGDLMIGLYTDKNNKGRCLGTINNGATKVLSLSLLFHNPQDSVNAPKQYL